MCACTFIAFTIYSKLQIVTATVDVILYVIKCNVNTKFYFMCKWMRGNFVFKSKIRWDYRF